MTDYQKGSPRRRSDHRRALRVVCDRESERMQDHLQDAARVRVRTEGYVMFRWHEIIDDVMLLLCLLALCLLSGCLTAAKIGQWQRAVYGWGMDAQASKPCLVASAKASAYLANANQRLTEAGKLTDLASDSQAKQLVTSAALACGKVVP